MAGSWAPRVPAFPRAVLHPCLDSPPPPAPDTDSSPWQVLKAHAEKAPQIADGFGVRMAQCCLASLARFLQR